MAAMTLRSAIPAIAFPAVMSGRAAELVALLRQYDQSQYWTADAMRQAQFAQVTALAEHAARTVPFHAERLARTGWKPGRAITPQMWRRLPILTRADVQQLGDKLHAAIVPPAFGPVSVVASGVPVRVRKTALDGVMWESVNLREECWHREGAQGDIFRLRGIPDGLSPEQAAAAKSPDGLTLPDWGRPANLVWRTGRITIVDPRLPLARQVALLAKLKPAWVQTFPSYLRLIIAHVRDTGARVPRLRGVFTASEMVSQELREDCAAVFGCRIIDNYTSGETGYIALQCPETDNLHIQSETALVEVLREDGAPCAPGEIGRVIVTPLHNFAMPLLRYAPGDEAEVASPCACDRTLPALARVVGRSEDFLVLPDGSRRRADMSHYRLSVIPAVREFRLVQRSLHLLVLQLVVSRPLTDEEMATVAQVMVRAVGDMFATEIEIVPALERTAVGKLRAFRSELPE